MLQDLGIGFIAAHSTQAKGRIERFWQTLQDRLVSELHLRGIDTMEAANAFLPDFLADLTPRFARPPADPQAAWRAAPRDLAAILSCRYSRVVAADNTVHLGARWVQLPRRRAYTGRRLELRECLDGRLLVFADGRRIATTVRGRGGVHLRLCAVPARTAPAGRGRCAGPGAGSAPSPPPLAAGGASVSPAPRTRGATPRRTQREAGG